MSPAVLAGAERNLATMAGWWGWRVPTHHDRTGANRPSAGPGRGTGLFFSRGIDSWSSLLTLQAEGAGPTHLLTIRDIELPARRRHPGRGARRDPAGRRPPRPAARGAVDQRPRRCSTGSRTGPAPTARCSPGSRCCSARCWPAPTSPAPTDPCRAARGAAIPTSIRHWSSETSELVHHQADLDRTEKTAIVARSQPALDSLLVCWEGGGAAQLRPLRRSASAR